MSDHIAIIGSGSWATALVKIFSEGGVPVLWVVRSNEQADYILSSRRNQRYLSYVELDTKFITPTTDVAGAIRQSTWIIFAVPSIYLGPILSSIDPGSVAGKQLVTSIKSFIQGTGCTPSVFADKYFGHTRHTMVLSGPCHAEEIAMGRETYMTIAGYDPAMVNNLAEMIHSSYMRTVGSGDPLGIETAAILKNVIGIAVGISIGLHYGQNFQAVLFSNAMREIDYLVNNISKQVRDLYNSAYFGDMLVTAYSEYSRNRTFGKLIGRGMQVAKALQSMEMVAEGYYASMDLPLVTGTMNNSLPVINTTYRILHEHANPFHEFKLLENQLL